MAVTRVDAGTTATLTEDLEIVLKTGYGSFTLGNATGLFTTAGVYVLQVDTSNMVAGNIVELRCYLCNIDNTATTDEKQAYYAVYANAQSNNMKLTVPIPVDGTTGGIKFTIKQTDATVKAFSWKIVTL